jgi:Uma2 family endonuclease
LFDDRVELIGEKIFKMSPAPSKFHQQVLIRISSPLFHYLKSRQAKLDDRGCIGAPDIVVEILSPGNNKIELLNKYNVYQELAVKEYWVVSPIEKSFLKYLLNENGKYKPSKLFTLSEMVHSEILPGFELARGF